MSTKINTPTVEQLNSIERRLEQMVERKWTPLCEKHDDETLEVWTEEERVCVGLVKKYWGPILMADVIRTFNKDHYEIWGVSKVTVRPKSASEFYEIPDGMDLRRAAVIEALDETGIHVPRVFPSWDTAELQYFETKEEAERAAAVLEDPIEEAYENTWNSGVEELEVREFEEHREWLAPDLWYSVLVRYG